MRAVEGIALFTPLGRLKELQGAYTCAQQRLNHANLDLNFPPRDDEHAVVRLALYEHVPLAWNRLELELLYQSACKCPREALYEEGRCEEGGELLVVSLQHGGTQEPLELRMPKLEQVVLVLVENLTQARARRDDVGADQLPIDQRYVAEELSGV
eukprot:3791133-Prymnesium_polylepis.3